jgi:hypothetical protein
MIAWLDTLIPPLDRTVGAWLLLALIAGWLLASLRNRKPVPPEPDPMAGPHGDVPRISRHG